MDRITAFAPLLLLALGAVPTAADEDTAGFWITLWPPATYE